MNWSAECTAVVPCLNEARAIGPLVRSIRAFISHVIVIDDGSTDDTTKHAREAGAEVVRHDVPRGKGISLRTGWEHARKRNFAWAISLDGDGQHAPEDIPSFFARGERGDASLIVGNRMIDARAMPPVRRFVNRYMSRTLSRAAGQMFPDSQCGFRLVNLDAVARVPLASTHFEIESEQLLAFAAAGEGIAFVPIRVIYRSEQSKIHPLHDTVRWVRWLRRWRSEQGVT
ncbi:MAG TPA: glycosyltransferase family 2 protein [Candidatus Acidoferrum sp.]|nr:glycosyltransferase family 2 protein [Candidatus Acidoferrum sp.]